MANPQPCDTAVKLLKELKASNWLPPFNVILPCSCDLQVFEFFFSSPRFQEEAMKRLVSETTELFNSASDIKK